MQLPLQFTARTLLFVPGNRPDRFEKALASGAQAVCIDLEDAVPAAEKDVARASTLEFLRRRRAGVFVCLRINGLRTQQGWRDLLSLRDSPPADAIMVPKVEHVEEMRLASSVCLRRERWIALVETALGMNRVEDIAAHAPDLAALMLGGADFAADIGATFAWEPLLAARQRIVQAAALRRLPAIDVPFLDLRDEAGLAEETRRIGQLGFSCKAAVHPSQVATISATLKPSEQEVARARQVVDAMARSDGGATVLDGEMLDEPVLRAARRTLERAA
jgi:citrate lyase subunit beta/citryl-CoA lyase/(S)-citramalyl-CoA lyase